MSVSGAMSCRTCFRGLEDLEAAACLAAHRSNWDLDKHSEEDDESPVASDQ